MPVQEIITKKCVATVLFTVPSCFLVAYVSGYVLLRWQDVIVHNRVALSCCMVGPPTIYLMSYVEHGKRFGSGRSGRLRTAIARPAALFYEPLCGVESRFRNRDLILAID